MHYIPRQAVQLGRASNLACAAHFAIHPAPIPIIYDHRLRSDASNRAPPSLRQLVSPSGLVGVAELSRDALVSVALGMFSVAETSYGAAVSPPGSSALSRTVDSEFFSAFRSTAFPCVLTLVAASSTCPWRPHCASTLYMRPRCHPAWYARLEPSQVSIALPVVLAVR